MVNNIFATEHDKARHVDDWKCRTMMEKLNPRTPDQMDIGVSGAVLNCTLERIENGYLVRVATGIGNISKTYFAPDLKAAGEQITALAVTYDLTDDPRRGGDEYVTKQA